MSKRAKLEEDEPDPAQPLKTESDTGLLETFNQALSRIITHQKTSTSPANVPDADSSSEQKPRPVIWFPDEAVRSSPNNTQEDHDKLPGTITCEIQQPIKIEEDRFDKYQEWIDGNAKFRYPLSLREAQSHSSGWAMKYTNNHNKFVLKKTCVGVLLCSNHCSLKDGNKVMIRPAISDKVRERQLGQSCPNSECKNGRIIHRKCTGNNGYPVTHFWVHHVDCIQFEAKGKHDHPKPEAKRTTTRKKELHTKYCYASQDALLYTPEFYPTSGERLPFIRYPRPTEVQTFSTFLEVHGECIKSYDISDGNEHVCLATPRMRDLVRETLGHESNVMNFMKSYVLCRTIPDYINGFNLLESRIVSCNTPECPLVLVTLYRSGAVDGVIEHIKYLTGMCSASDQKIRVPKWHFLVHDFEQNLLSLVVETMVNLMVDSQMQILLNEFQYKSVSSLYKMLRQKMFGTMRTFEEHFMICKYELLLRIQDPITIASSEELFSHLQSQYYTAKEFLTADTLIKDGVFGSHVREFWRFWGNEVISPAVFSAAKRVYAPGLHSFPHCSARGGMCQGTARIQDAFMSLIHWVEKRGVLFLPSSVWIPSYHKQQPKVMSTWVSQPVSQQSFTKSHGMPVIISYGSCYGEQAPYFAMPARSDQCHS